MRRSSPTGPGVRSCNARATGAGSAGDLSAASAWRILEAMSRENVQVVRKAWEAWLRGDLSALFETYAPDIVWDTSYYRDWPASNYEGVEAVQRFMNEWLAVWDEYEVGVEDIFAAPDGRVVVLFWHRGRGRSQRARSGVVRRASPDRLRRQDQTGRQLRGPSRSPQSRGSSGVAPSAPAMREEWKRPVDAAGRTRLCYHLSYHSHTETGAPVRCLGLAMSPRRALTRAADVSKPPPTGLFMRVVGELLPALLPVFGAFTVAGPGSKSPSCWSPPH